MANDLYVKDRLYAHLTVEGYDLPTDAGTYSKITIIENAAFALPVLQFSLRDSSRSLQKGLNLIDGTRIQIRLGKKQGDASYQEFSVFSSKLAGEGSAAQVTVNCLLNYPIWSGRIQRASRRGTSSQVISSLAAESGLSSRVEATADSQTWLGLQQTTCSWAAAITAHSYRSDTACMGLAVTARGECLYKDLVALIFKKPKSILSQDNSAPDTLLIHQERSSSSSGTSNNLYNYGYEVLTRTSDGSIKRYNQVQAKVSENSVSINRRSSQDIGTRKVVFASPTEGNAHENYHKAFHQNARLRALFSERESVLLYEVSGLELFDTVELRLVASPADQSLTNRSGTYFVVAKSRVLRGITYAERLELVRHQVKHEGVTPSLSSIGSPSTTTARARSAELSQAEKDRLVVLNPDGTVQGQPVKKPSTIEGIKSLLLKSRSMNLPTVMGGLGLSYQKMTTAIYMLRRLLPPTFEGFTQVTLNEFPQLIAPLTPAQVGAMRNLFESGTLIDNSHLVVYASELGLPPTDVFAVLGIISELEATGTVSPSTLIRVLSGDVWDGSPPPITSDIEGLLQQLQDISSNPQQSLAATDTLQQLGSNPITAIAQSRGLTTAQTESLLNEVSAARTQTELADELQAAGLSLTPTEVATSWSASQDMALTWAVESGTVDYLSGSGVSIQDVISLMAQAGIPIQAIEAVCSLAPLSSDALDYAFALRDVRLGHLFTTAAPYLNATAQLFDILRARSTS